MAIGLALQDDDQGIQIQTMFDECFIVFGLTVFLIGKICFFHTKEKVAPDCYKRSFAPVFHHFSPFFTRFWPFCIYYCHFRTTFPIFTGEFCSFTVTQNVTIDCYISVVEWNTRLHTQKFLNDISLFH